MRGFFSPIMSRRFSPPWSIALGPAKKRSPASLPGLVGQLGTRNSAGYPLVGRFLLHRMPNSASDSVGGIMIAELLAMLIGHNEFD
jgi:hypothetical protein